MKYILLLILCLFFSHVTAETHLDIHKYGWDTPEKHSAYRQDLLARQNILQNYNLQKQNSSDNLLRSALIPGWGQYRAKRFTKGQIIMISQIASLTATYMIYLESMDYYDKYKKSNYIGDIERYYDKAQSKYDQYQSMVVLSAMIWAINMIDSVFTTGKYNNEIWLKLYYDKTRSLSLTPNGLSLKF